MGRTLCAAFPNTSLLFVWMKLLLPGAPGAREVAEILHETMKKLLLALLPRFSGQMGLGKVGPECSQEILTSPCAAALSNQRCHSYSWLSLAKKTRGLLQDWEL